MPSSILRHLGGLPSRWPRNLRIVKSSSFSTYKLRSVSVYRTRLFLAGATLLLGVPIGYSIGKGSSKSSFNTPSNNLGELYDGSLNWKGKFVRPCTMKHVEAWLVKEQGIHCGPAGSGVREWHSSRHASNSPCEDELVSASVRLDQSFDEGAQPWMFWGVFDGHVGGTTSAVLRESLVPYVARSLSQLFRSRSRPEVQGISKIEEEDVVTNAIKSTFKQLDDEFIQEGIEALKTAKTATEALSQLAPGLAGACAILAIYEPNRNILRVANVGDCRGVLGTLDYTTNKYITTPLSVDQNGFNKSEIARVRAEHPGEKDVVDEKTGRTLGMAPSRVFGDGIWKWPRKEGVELYEHFWSFKPRGEKVYLTPPYLTAEPVVTTTKLERKGAFMILATDGLWDCMSSEQAVKLVEMWLQAKKTGNFKKKLRAEIKKTGLAKRIPKDRRVKEEDFVVLDENCATHLVRNALGGGDEEVLCAVIGAAPSFSRDARDDITVQVIFFDH